MDKEAIAAVCHEANRKLCLSQGDATQPDWTQAPEWQVNSAVGGVYFHLHNPEAGPEASHENWMALKEVEGWIYGEVKDAEAKTHPCMVPFDQLPPEQQAKDHLFRAIVHALAPFLNRVEPVQNREKDPREGPGAPAEVDWDNPDFKGAE